MTNEDMKVLKFKVMLDEVFDKMVRWESGNIKFGKMNDIQINGVGILFENESNNLYAKMLYGPYEFEHYRGHECNMNGENSQDIAGLIRAIKRCKSCHPWQMCSILGKTIFFSLMALAVDEKLYEEKLETVSDAAYMMGFNEEMMEDWIAVVKKFLLAEKIDSEQLKTEEAKKFFAFFNK